MGSWGPPHHGQAINLRPCLLHINPVDLVPIRHPGFAPRVHVPTEFRSLLIYIALCDTRNLITSI